jgi:signal peptidase I
MQASYFTRHPKMRDGLNFVIFVVLVLVGTLFINTFVFRSFNVSGHSMEDTLQDGDRLIVDRLPVTLAHLQNKPYVPNRGDIVIFKNPQYTTGSPDEYIVKRVVAFPGERVTVHDGVLMVYNGEFPGGFEPDKLDVHGHPLSPTSGEVDTTVANNSIFVAGDNRIGNNSCDSRSCLGLIPLYDIIGPVGLRIWPLNNMTTL